jgi:hypothetical protein
MRLSSWQRDTAGLKCDWSEIGQGVRYNPRWMQETPNTQSSYLPPNPDFASHSPFGGAFWFLPHLAYRDFA